MLCESVMPPSFQRISASVVDSASGVVQRIEPSGQLGENGYFFCFLTRIKSISWKKYPCLSIVRSDMLRDISYPFPLEGSGRRSESPRNLTDFLAWLQGLSHKGERINVPLRSERGENPYVLPYGKTERGELTNL